MRASLSRTLLEKAAIDNGFDLPLAADVGWLAFASTQAPLQIWLSTAGEGLFVVALSRANVAAALGHATVKPRSLPQGAFVALMVTSLPALHQLVRRAFQLARTLPDELLHRFEEATAGLPRATEVERLVVQRVGQDIFRTGLLEYWNGRCAVTGLGVSKLLRASHIKRWADCETDAERLDVFNGLLLAPQLDAAFDCGLMTVADDGAVIWSPNLAGSERELLGATSSMEVRSLAPQHLPYLKWHRQWRFERG